MRLYEGAGECNCHTELVPDIIKLLVEGCARVASEGNGLPLETFKTLADHVLDHLVPVNVRESKAIREARRAQDRNYLARMFQSVFVNLQDYQGEIP